MASHWITDATDGLALNKDRSATSRQRAGMTGGTRAVGRPGTPHPVHRDAFDQHRGCYRGTFRRQVDGQPISFDLLGHCADRYGVSLMATALRWTEISPKRAVLVASRDISSATASTRCDSPY